MDIFLRAKAILGLKNSQKISIRAIGISVSGLQPKSHLPLLKKDKIEEHLSQVTDKINDKYGDWTIYPAALTLIHSNLNSQR